MIVIVLATLWLISSLLICVLSFWIGRCARKLPIIDDRLPWTMSRHQSYRYAEGCTEQHTASPGSRASM